MKITDSMGGRDRVVVVAAVAAEAATATGAAGDERKRETHINRHVFPQAPSPTMTSFRRSSAILEVVFDAR